jgi:hypothetical protein
MKYFTSVAYHTTPLVTSVKVFIGLAPNCIFDLVLKSLHYNQGHLLLLSKLLPVFGKLVRSILNKNSLKQSSLLWANSRIDYNILNNVTI